MSHSRVQFKDELASLKQELNFLRLKHSETDTPPELFHYTDARGLIGILSSQQVWATHAFYLNDATEIRHTQEIVENIHDDLLKQAKPDDKAKSDINHPLWVYRDFLAYISYKTARVKPDPDVFVTCFCENDDILSQWREYGNKGSGYAVGFDTKRLYHPGNAFELRKVLYSVGEQNYILNEILEAVTTSLKRMTATLNVNSAQLLIEAHANIFEKEVTRYATFFKHQAFQEEEEWRLIHFPTGSAYSNHIKYRSGNLGIVPYVEISLPDGENSCSRGILPIASIRIGPTAQPELARKALEMFVGSTYPNLEISSSAIPLR